MSRKDRLGDMRLRMIEDGKEGKASEVMMTVTFMEMRWKMIHSYCNLAIGAKCSRLDCRIWNTAQYSVQYYCTVLNLERGGPQLQPPHCPCFISSSKLTNQRDESGCYRGGAFQIRINLCAAV